MRCKRCAVQNQGITLSSLISSLILWHSVGKVHLCKLTYPEAIASDSGLDTRDLSSAMANCGVWKEISSMNVPSSAVVKG